MVETLKDVTLDGVACIWHPLIHNKLKSDLKIENTG
jgi:hypothetical protein